MDNVKTIAIYFPQFHAIPENDEWWGKGFTDWNNVRKGYPLYEGHHQPRVPLNNNYYDLSQLDTIRWQVQPVAEHAQCALQHLLQRTGQVCDRPFGVQAATILPQGLLHKLIAGGAIIQLVKCVHFLPHFV